MGDGFREINLTDREQGELKLLVVTPRDGDPWGLLAPLRDTAWGRQVAIVSGEALSHAMHGWATPLVREIGVPPRVRAKRVPEVCALNRSCLGFKAGICQPGPDLPDCYEPPGLEGPLRSAVTQVALAWREGRFVVVVNGPEFALT